MLFYKKLYKRLYFDIYEVTICATFKNLCNIKNSGNILIFELLYFIFKQTRINL